MGAFQTCEGERYWYNRPVLNYILRRLGQSIIVLLTVMLITFTLPYFEVGGILAPAYACLLYTSRCV